MATNTTEMASGHWIEAEGLRLKAADRPANGKSGWENGTEQEAGAQWALAPLVDKIAYGLARGLVVAMKELETHIASETRKVSDSVGRRLDTLQASFQDLTGAVSEQRAMNLAVQDRCQQLEAATASLHESSTRHAEEISGLRGEAKEFSAEVAQRIGTLGQELGARQDEAVMRLDGLAAATASLQQADAQKTSELSALRSETRESSAALSERINTICRDLGLQQEDMEAVKTALGGISARVDGVVERLDRQADALRSLYATYAQRETELEQLVDGLARLRSYPARPATPANAL
jgi:chromosome segregation ATPase